MIFLPFRRGEEARRVAKGAGLGLFVVKQIVEAHGGTVGVGRVVGRGTTMKIPLPLPDT